MEKVISVITVVFNSVNLIENTIKSIVNQSYLLKEVVVVDGGSTDGTKEIIERYRDKIDQYISEPDKGLYDAMNKGLNLATGNYVIFINSGDLLKENILSRIFEQHDPSVDVFYGETDLINETGQVLGTRSALTTRKLPVALTWKSMIKGMVVSHQSFIPKRSLAPEYQLQYKCSADIDWVITCLKRSKKNQNVQGIISEYLIGGFSIKNQKRCWKERFQVYQKHYGWIPTLIAHFYIVVRAMYYKIAGKENY